MVVVGAASPAEPCTGSDRSNAEGKPGPPQLTLDVFRTPLEAAGLTTVQISLSRMNPTPHYKTTPDGLPPLAWVGVFQKVPWDDEARYALEVQQPFSRFILDGQKTIETRAYPLPPCLLGKPIYLLESHAGAAGVSSLPSHIPVVGAHCAHLGAQDTPRIIGVVTFGSCTLYDSSAAWEADREKHLVPAGSLYDWSAGTGTCRYDDAFVAREQISLQEGKLSELYAWHVTSIDGTSCVQNSTAMNRIYRSIFKLEV